jgi:hypothetical protein
MKRLHFYPNTKDNTHCFQASIRMILKYFFPEKNYSFNTLDVMTHKVKGMWTWPMEGILALHSMGLEVVKIGLFDYAAFSKDPEQYLFSYYNDPFVVQEQLCHCDIKQEQKSAERFSQFIQYDKRIPTYQDIIDVLHQKYLLILNVNAHVLNRRNGYAGHFVLVYRATSHTIWMYDPGLPPKIKRRVTRRVFEEAWGYPTEKSKNILGFRKKLSFE